MRKSTQCAVERGAPFPATTPLWAWSLSAWLLVAGTGEAWRSWRELGAVAAASGSASGMTEPESPEPAAERGSAWPAYPGVTALRSLRGVGDGRAVDLVRLRWERGPDAPPLALSEVRGIGPAIEQRASAAWVERVGAAPGAPLLLAPRPPAADLPPARADFRFDLSKGFPTDPPRATSGRSG